jgi:serine/threonine protein kinase
MPFDLPKYNRLFIDQLLCALRLLHAQGIHHHDVRGSNILVGPQGSVTLIDFERAEMDAKCIVCSDIILRRKLEADSVVGFKL